MQLVVLVGNIKKGTQTYWYGVYLSGWNYFWFFAENTIPISKLSTLVKSFCAGHKSSCHLCSCFVYKGVTQRICFDYNNTVESDSIWYCISSSLLISIIKKAAKKRAVWGKSNWWGDTRRKSKIICGFVYPQKRFQIFHITRYRLG